MRRKSLEDFDNVSGYIYPVDILLSVLSEILTKRVKVELDQLGDNFNNIAIRRSVT